MHSVPLSTKVAAAVALRERITRFLGNGTPWKKPLRYVIALIQERQWKAVIFGGVIRDLAVFGPAERPRDVDVVVSEDVPNHELESAFGKWIVRRTRFGGLHLLVDKWMFDIWNVAGTWGIIELGVAATFDVLPKTTFLNVEAIAAEIGTTKGQQRALYTHGFFEALESKSVEINLKENPFPALCVVRSLLTAARLNFSIGPALGDYIVRYARDSSIRELVEVQRSHYGVVRVPEPRLDAWINSIDVQLAARKPRISLPLERGEQLEFSNFWCPSV
jgi:hypothetical protein